MIDPQHDTGELIRRAAAADPDATAQLMARHRDRLRRMVAIRLDPRLSPRLDASDIVQDVLAEAVQKLPAYLVEQPLSFYAWLRRLAWQQLIEEYRKHVRAERRSVEREKRLNLPLPNQSAIMLADVLVAQQSSPSQHMHREQMRKKVRDGLGKLRKHDRELLVLRYLEQLAFGEIAEALGSTEPAVKMRHVRALQRLGAILHQTTSSG